MNRTMNRAYSKIFIIVSLLMAFMLISAILLTGCGSGAGQMAATTDTPSDDTETGPEDTGLTEETEGGPDAAEEAVSAFKADGIIGEGEYKYSKTFEDFDLFWSNDTEFVYIAMKAETEGYVSVAVQPGSRMNEADIITGWVEDGKPGIVDMFSTGDFGPHPPDTELGGANDIMEFGGKEEGGFTIIEFKRALNTADEYDNALVQGSNQIIWAYATSDDPGAKHMSRGYGEITID